MSMRSDFLSKESYIYGIGRSLSNKILKDAKIDVNKKDLNLKEKLMEILSD